MARPIGEWDGSPQMVVCSVLDQTERLHSDARLEAKNQDLELANEELRTYVEELQSQQEELDVQQEELEAQSEELAAKAREIEALLEKEKTSSAEALRLSEVRFQAIFDQAFAGVAELGAGGHINRANAMMTELTGYTEGELIGRLFYRLTHLDDLKTELELYTRVAYGPLDRYTLEKRLVREDGSLLWVDSSLSAIRGVSDRDDRFVLILLDIGKRKEAEVERERLLAAEQEARAAAEGAVKVRDEFLSLAAHELKTPIASLRGFAQFVQRRIEKRGGVSPEQLSAAMDRIDQQTKRLNSLISGLLDVSRLETGKLSIVSQEADLSRIIEGALELVRGVYPTRTFLFQGQPDVRALLDPLRTEQVMVNLLDNAAKFSPNDAPVEVDLTLVGEEEVQISVRDYGKGMAEADRERLFQRFYQAHEERHFGGMGLGLYISGQIAQMQGGTVTYEAPEDGGSKFVVRLPLKGTDGRSSRA